MRGVANRYIKEGLYQLSSWDKSQGKRESYRWQGPHLCQGRLQHAVQSVGGRLCNRSACRHSLILKSALQHTNINNGVRILPLGGISEAPWYRVLLRQSFPHSISQTTCVAVRPMSLLFCKRNSVESSAVYAPDICHFTPW